MQRRNNGIGMTANGSAKTTFEATSFAPACSVLLIALFAALIAPAGATTAQNVGFLHTNEAYVEEVSRPSAIVIDDPMSVFAFVFDNLTERVTVYPSENYYYFHFIHNGTRYAGNLRLDPRHRDQGNVDFVYYVDTSQWNDRTPSKYAVLGAAQGVTVEQLEPIVYRISYRQKSVVFVLNDLAHVKPPPNAIAPHERFLGPVFDESAVRFFLVYNNKLKIFHYVLDETEKATDEFFPTKRTNRILIGKRTGFAFYRDHQRDRKILIGVFEGNSVANNYFDGPFDQLPENIIEGESLRSVILDSDPSLRGKIDRLGNFLDGTGRYAIHPYLLYRTVDGLYAFHRCATSKKVPATVYHQCFDAGGQTQSDARPPPKRPARSR